MVDENGKLFGKVNLIDFLIVVILVAVAIFAALRATGVIGRADTEHDPVRISFYGSEVPDFVLDYIIPGNPLYDPAEDLVMGYVEGFEAGEPVGYEYTVNGDIKEVSRSGHSSVNVSIISNAEIVENGVRIDGVLYGVGHTMVLYAGQAKMYLKVAGIEAAE